MSGIQLQNPMIPEKAAVSDFAGPKISDAGDSMRLAAARSQRERCLDSAAIILAAT